MSVLREIGGITRRQFIKGIGVLVAVVAIGSVFFKFGKDAYAASEKYVAMRAQGLYKNDESMPIRKSHENPEIKTIYKDFLEQPLSERSEHLLHTSYVNRYMRQAG